VKLLALVAQFGGEPIVYLHGGQALFFSGKKPKAAALIAIELPGLKRLSAARAWLIGRNRHGGDHPKREQVEIPESLWRPAVIDDFLDAHNAEQLVWHVSTAFTVADVAQFAEDHGPPLLREIRTAMDVERERKPRALAEIQQPANRYVYVTFQASRLLQSEADRLREELDREDAAELVTSPFEVTSWVDGIRQLRTDNVKREVLDDLGQQLAERPHLIAEALDKLATAKLDRIAAPIMWTRIANLLPLDATISGKTIDLTTATEVTVPAGWELWTAERIGPVRPGRAALRVMVGKRVHLVRGERKLKHRIRERGGQIQRWGCTLVVGGDAGTSGVHTKLLEVERIDTLAQIDPARAVAIVADTHPHDPAIAAALRNALDDPRWRRVLADLVIERAVGIDADVARRLSRAQARANRR